MNFFKQSSDQAREAFTSMPMQSRLISVMLVVAIAIGLAFLVRGTEANSTTYLFGGRAFSEQELDGIEISFSTAGLNGWQREGRRIKLPRDTQSDYLAALQGSTTLPSSLQSRVQEAINASSVFESKDLMQARLQAARAEDLGKRISMFPEVKTASVVYDQGERRGLSRARPQSASVFVVPEGADPLPRHRVGAIKEMVRGCYAELSIDDINVTDAHGTTVSSLDAEEDPQLRKQQDTEAWYKQKIRSALSDYPAIVEVFADIDPTMDVEKASTTFDSEGTTISNRSRKIESENNRKPVGGLTGTGPNATSNRATSIDDELQSSKLSDKTDDVQKVAGQQYERSRTASLTVKSISVTVGLPRSFFKSIYIQESLEQDPNLTVADVPPMNDDSFEKLKTTIFGTIESVVPTLLPLKSPGDDRTTFVETYVATDLPSDPLPGPDNAKVALTWLAESWQSLALICLALIALLVARSAARSSGDTPPVEFREGFGLELPQAPPEPESAEDADAMTITGSNLKDELIAIVEENPEVAANVIRGWVAEAA
jgi:flagellar M-ring protein FliF